MNPALGIALRICIVAVSLGVWHWTQRLIAARPVASAGDGDGSGGGGIGDRVHVRTERVNAWLHAHPRATDRLVAVSSVLVDLLGLALIALAVLGPTFRPFLGVLTLFALRQVCQALCAMPIPRGMIWRDPGFPSLLVTYGTSNDLFFSGHTALCVFGAMELARSGPAWLATAAGVVAAAQVVFVLLLRAHWTADVVAAVFAALCCDALAVRLAPTVDAWLRTAAG